MAEVRRSNPNGFAALKKRLEQLESVQGKVGWFENSKYEGGTPVAYVATIQEFGYGPIPPRPMLRPTVAREQKAWALFAGNAARMIMKGEITPDAAMEALTLRAAGDVRRTISDVQSPPLSPITLQLRQWRKEGRIISGKTVGEAARVVSEPGWQKPAISDKPLIDPSIGLLFSSVTGKVEKV